jgi:hypothetical protein
MGEIKSYVLSCHIYMFLSAVFLCFMKGGSRVVMRSVGVYGDILFS